MPLVWECLNIIRMNPQLITFSKEINPKENVKTLN